MEKKSFKEYTYIRANFQFLDISIHAILIENKLYYKMMVFNVIAINTEKISNVKDDN